MAENIAPTRSNLLQRRDQLKLAIRGADLLKRKRDALIGEFFALVKTSLQARRALTKASQEAYLALFLANAWDGPEALKQHWRSPRGAPSRSRSDVENLFGVKVPQVSPRRSATPSSRSRPWGSAPARSTPPPSSGPSPRRSSASRRPRRACGASARRSRRRAGASTPSSSW
jgi:H(+)-transporting ATP synthase subunit D